MDNWRAKLGTAGVPASPIRRLDAVVNDPQCAVREMFPHATDPGTGQVRVVGSPIKLPEQPAVVLSSAPQLGQHTSETLSDWFGMDSTDLGHLTSSGGNPARWGCMHATETAGFLGFEQYVSSLL